MGRAKSSIQVVLPLETIKAIRYRTRTIPGQTLSSIATEAVEDWLEEIEGQRWELRDLEGRPFVKEAGEQFPQRLNNRARTGRPDAGEETTRDFKRGSAKLYFDPDTANRVRNAAWWRIAYLSSDIGAALDKYLEINKINTPHQTI